MEGGGFAAARPSIVRKEIGGALAFKYIRHLVAGLGSYLPQNIFLCLSILFGTVHCTTLVLS